MARSSSLLGVSSRKKRVREERPLLPFYRVLVTIDPGQTTLPLGLRGRLVVTGPARPLVASLIAASLRNLRFADVD